MLCSRFLKLEAGGGHSSSKSGWIYRSVDSFYGWILRWSLKYRYLTLGVCLLVVGSTVPIAMSLGVNLVPRDDQSEFQVGFITPEGYTLERTNAVISEIENRLVQLPGVVHRYTSIGQGGTPKAKAM